MEALSLGIQYREWSCWEICTENLLWPGITGARIGENHWRLRKVVPIWHPQSTHRFLEFWNNNMRHSGLKSSPSWDMATPDERRGFPVAKLFWSSDKKVDSSLQQGGDCGNKGLDEPIREEPLLLRSPNRRGSLNSIDWQRVSMNLIYRVEWDIYNPRSFFIFLLFFIFKLLFLNFWWGIKRNKCLAKWTGIPTGGGL